MKKIVLMILLIGNLVFAQNFFQSEHIEDNTEQPQTGYFSQEHIPNEYDPEQGNDGPGNPGPPVPINNWQFLLTLAGVGVGVWFLRKRYKTA